MIVNLGTMIAPRRKASSVAPPPYAATKCISFNGTTDYLSRLNAAAQNFTTAMTINAWVKGAATADDAQIGGIYSDLAPKSYLLARSAVAGKIDVIIYDGANTKFYVSSITAFDSAWHMITFTFGASTLKLYVDGTLDASPTKTIDAAVSSLSQTTRAFASGCRLTGTTPVTYYAGKITNLSLWSIALDQTGVTALRTSSKPADLSLHADYANCVSWYKFGDGDTIGADGIIDTKGGLHLSATGTPTIQTDAP